MNNVFKAFLSKDLPASPIQKASQAAVIALSWSIIVAANEKRDSDCATVEFPKLIEYQTNFYRYAISSQNVKVSEKAKQILREFFTQNENMDVFYFDKLLSKEPSSNIIVFLSTILEYKFDVDGTDDLLTANQEKLMDHFIKGLITCKVKPNSNYFVACRIFLKSITPDLWKQHILSALQRAMLRSPEIVLQSVGAIVRELEFDISDHSMDLGKTLIQNLYSKNDSARIEAVESLKEVAFKCKDIKAIEALLNLVFAVLNGSDGKITVVEYRMNVLQVIFSVNITA